MKGRTARQTDWEWGHFLTRTEGKIDRPMYEQTRQTEKIDSRLTTDTYYRRVSNIQTWQTTQTSEEILPQLRKKLRLDFLRGILPWRYSWNWVMWYPSYSTALRFKLLLFFVFLLLFLLIYFSGTSRVWEGKAISEIFTLTMSCERILSQEP